MWSLEPKQVVNLVVIASYLAGLLGLGVYLARYVRSEADFFLAGRCLNRWTLAGTLLATNVAAVFLIAPAASAARNGPAILMIAWSSNMVAALAAVVIVPRWRAQRITTITQFLQERFGLAISVFILLLWVVYYTAFAGLNLYAVAAVLGPITSIDARGLILVSGAAITICCASSGMIGVVYTGVPQAFLVVLGGAVLLPVALGQIGGLRGLQAAMPPEAWRVWNPSDEAAGVLDVLMYILLALPYWCTSQYMLQRTFGAKDLRQASRGLLLGALLTGPLMLTYILPDMAAGVASLRQPIEVTSARLPELFYGWLPAGLGGLYVAGLMAAGHSTASSLVNSAATLVDHDFYRKLWREPSDANIVWMGRALTVVVGVLAAAFALYCASRQESALTRMYQIMSLVEPPVFVVAAAGLLWPGVSRTGAVLGLLCGFGFGLGSLAGWFGSPEASATVYRTLWGFPISAVGLIVGSALVPGRRTGVAPPLARPAGPYSVGPRLGLALATAALLGFVAAAVHEPLLVPALPAGANVPGYLLLSTLFILGLYLAVPMFVPLPRETVTIPMAGDVELSWVHRAFASGWTWLGLYGLAALIMWILFAS